MSAEPVMVEVFSCSQTEMIFGSNQRHGKVRGEDDFGDVVDYVI